MHEEEAKKYAEQVFKARSERAKELEREKEQRIHTQAMNILDIFDRSTKAKDSSILIWDVCLRGKKDKEDMEVGAVVKGVVVREEFLNNNGLGEVAEAVERVKIPKELYADIYIYFQYNLSEYFEIDGLLEETIITLKRQEETVCEKEKAEE